ncbi:spermine synthase [Thermosulfurimonas sp. F29]|uniref:spermine/spermidine synthase domain-containing protein n=1 Tax=Thermosulfurimonas sp. F29 TaxID=2867247 RepID=UPI001C8302D3|nr:spermine synthase [Thermosulfurimonas sp. F29]MBX6423815.1 spermine synthase [Thermosulfurimonas sp. F29]
MPIMENSLPTEGRGAKIILGEPVQRGYFYGYEGIVLHEEGGEQAILVMENAFWGRILFINGTAQFTSRDEFIYHEALVHIPFQAFPEGRVKKVLICGGGDYGAAREVLKYPEVEKVLIADIDPRVPRVVREFFPELLPSNPSDPRLELLTVDAFKLVEDLVKRGEKFDLVIVDSTDPDVSVADYTIELSHSLFSEDFHRMLLKLAPEGAIVQQAATPFTMKDILEGSYTVFRKVYGKETHCYRACIPSFGGDNAYLLRFPGDPREPRRKSVPETHYYTHEVHRASFALPKFWLTEVLEKDE